MFDWPIRTVSPIAMTERETSLWIPVNTILTWKTMPGSMTVSFVAEMSRLSSLNWKPMPKPRFYAIWRLEFLSRIRLEVVRYASETFEPTLRERMRVSRASWAMM